MDGDRLDEVISAWINHRLAGRTVPEPIAADGKTLRGTFARTGGAGMYLLSALTHHRAGTSEIAWMQPLLDRIGLGGVVVTADALHTTRGLAAYLAGRGAG